jgi:nucleoside permease NupC
LGRARASLKSLKTWFGNPGLRWCGIVGHPEVNFTSSLSVFFFPFSVLMGTPIQDCWAMGRLLGIKTAANEFVAYSELMEMQKSGALHERFEA